MPESASTSDKTDIRHLSHWDTDPLKRPQWISTILRELPIIVDGYDDFITYGTLHSGKYVGVPTIGLVSELKGGTVVYGTPRLPSTVRNATPEQIAAAILLDPGSGCPIARAPSLSQGTDSIPDTDKHRYSLMPEPQLSWHQVQDFR